MKDFIEAYENAFGERLTVAQANELFLRLLHLYRSIRRATNQAEASNSADVVHAAD